MSKQQTYIDKELLHGNGKRYINLFPENEIKDFNVEGYENVPSEDFDPGFGCVPVKEVKPIPGPPEFTPELIERLANKEAKTGLGKLWQAIYKEQTKKQSI